MLIQRRDKIGQAYLNAINPVVNVALQESGELSFDNAAVAAGVGKAPNAGYLIHWARFDNTTNQAGGFGTSTAGANGRSQAPGALPTEAGAYLMLQIRAVEPAQASWGTPVVAYFRRDGGWKLVGLER